MYLPSEAILFSPSSGICLPFPTNIGTHHVVYQLSKQPAVVEGRKGGIPSRPSFSDYDADGDGLVTLAEVEAQLPELGGDAGAQILIDLFDTNLDGVIDEEEFAAAKACIGLPMVRSLVRTFVPVNFSPSYRYTGKFGILNS